MLAEFESPTGECVDKSGNVYIADTDKKAIYEYAHGGKKAIKALDDSPYVPNGCSVDPTPVTSPSRTRNRKFEHG